MTKRARKKTIATQMTTELINEQDDKEVGNDRVEDEKADVQEVDDDADDDGVEDDGVEDDGVEDDGVDDDEVDVEGTDVEGTDVEGTDVEGTDADEERDEEDGDDAVEYEEDEDEGEDKGEDEKDDTNRAKYEEVADKHVTKHGTQQSSRKGRRLKRAKARSGSAGLLEGVIDLISTTMTVLKTPLVLGFSFLLILLLARIILTLAHATICGIPGITLFMSSCKVPPTLSRMDYEDVVRVHAELDAIQEQAAGGLSIPLIIKRGESAIREVSIVVQLSQLPSKLEMVPIMENFHKLASRVGDDMHGYYSRMLGLHESIIILTSRTERQLTEIKLKKEVEDRPATGLVPAAVKLISGPPASPMIAVNQQFLKYIEMMKDEIHILISEHRIILEDMRTLEEYLYSIARLEKIDDHIISGSKQDLEGRFLQVFGYYSKELGNLDKSMVALTQLVHARRMALKQVEGVSTQLNILSADLTALRERIVERQRVSDDDAASLEYQVQMIHGSLDRMRLASKKNRDAKSQWNKDILAQIKKAWSSYN